MGIVNEAESNAIKMAKQGDLQAFEDLIIKYEKTIYNVAYKIMKNEEDAKDVFQDVCIKIYKNISGFEEGAKFSTWLYSVTYNTCIDELRKRKNKEAFSLDQMIETGDSEYKPDVAGDAKTPEEAVIKQEEQQDLVKAISELSDEYRAFLVLRDIQGLSYNEIAEATNTALGTVKSRISRARFSLKGIILKARELSREQNKQLGV